MRFQKYNIFQIIHYKYMMDSKICSLHLLLSSHCAAPGGQIQIFVWLFDQGHWLDIKLDTFSTVIVWETHTDRQNANSTQKPFTTLESKPGPSSETPPWGKFLERKKQLWATIKGFLFFQFVQHITGLYWQLGQWDKRESWRFGLSQARHSWPSCSCVWLYRP